MRRGGRRLSVGEKWQVNSRKCAENKWPSSHKTRRFERLVGAIGVVYRDDWSRSSFPYDGRDINTDLILHEEMGKTLIDQLNLYYLHAGCGPKNVFRAAAGFGILLEEAVS
jgi:hypothetical protein